MKGSVGIALATTLALALVTAGEAHAQTSVSSSGDSVVVRVYGARDRAKIRARIDSLRKEFAQASSDEDRVRIGREMNRQIELLSGDSWDDDRNVWAYSTDAARASTSAAIAKSYSDAARNAAKIVLNISPRGWIGINMAAPSMQRMVDGTMTIRYFEYPEIVSVDANSPAERAGVQRGDVLLAFNNDDVREREVDMSKLLVPGKKVTLRLRRDDAMKLLPVTVAPVPQQVQSRRAMTWTMQPDPMPAMAPMPPMAPMPATPRAMTMPSMAGMAPMMASTWESSKAPVAGAQVMPLTDGLMELTGVHSGVFVVSVAAGSPAEDAGLRDGDVITYVGNQPVMSVSQLRALLVANDDGSVKVQIVRAHQKRTITFSR